MILFMETSNKRNGIIFDLDGTLWEVTESTFYSANKTTNKYKLKEISKETICKVFGLNKEESAKLYFPYLELSESMKLIDEIATINIENLKQKGGNIYPNLIETFNILKEKYDLFIVSNTAEIEYIEAFLISSGTKSFFKDYIAASKLRISKAEAIKKIIKENNIDKSVYVGDTIIDLEAAKIANIPFIYAKYGFGKNIKTNYFINELKELPSLLKEML